MSQVAIQIRPMQTADVGFGETLVAESKWNQTQSDWMRFLKLQQHGCFVATLSGQLAGTATTCLFCGVGWIAMVLVETRFRRQGVGRALMLQALSYLENQGAESIRLDATSLGEPLYRSLGFTAQFQLARFSGNADSHGRRPQNPRAHSHDLQELSALDQQVVGYDRSSLLTELCKHKSNSLITLGTDRGIGGFVITRPGRVATQIGPCIANSAAVGETLFENALSNCVGEVFIDIPLGNHLAVNKATSLQLTPTRRFIRMCRGKPIEERIDRLWCSSGPEMG
jgi:GNAT superfamily N-acetyltransferase